ncbi:1-hydroxy-2-glutathionyl-2-methyl-3-butene dehydrogenase [Pseudonocardia thermophila]|jgi:Short-chain dehydrogenases of various substrate specificities|uniref:1-hydroxy-2-glutathionyl-2-methyl-3-butene dehydrogenase n=1 Tax=Pseudonocardia thermophila TaxID=1848 RepID=UPI00248D7186|nr:SDR family oxidoreductase [Pseudonocardia thermophila]
MATAVVIGADRGIAHAIARQLHERGDAVTAACLVGNDELAAAGVTVHGGVDVTSQDAVEKFAAALGERRVSIDVLYHVAGVLGLDTFGSLDYDEIRRQFEINALGPLRTVEALRDLLHDGSKVGIVTSRVGSLADNSSGGMYAYRISKAAANMVARNLHHELGPRGIHVLALHPGMVATDLTKDFPGDFTYIQPDEAAAGLIGNMDRLTAENAGRFQHANGSYLDW